MSTAGLRDIILQTPFSRTGTHSRRPGSYSTAEALVNRSAIEIGRGNLKRPAQSETFAIYASAATSGGMRTARRTYTRPSLNERVGLVDKFSDTVQDCVERLQEENVVYQLEVREQYTYAFDVISILPSGRKCILEELVEVDADVPSVSTVADPTQNMNPNADFDSGKGRCL